MLTTIRRTGSVAAVRPDSHFPLSKLFPHTKLISCCGIGMRAGHRRTVLPGAASGGGGQGAAACSSASLAPASCSHRAAVSHSGQRSGGDQIRMGPCAPPNGPVGRCSRSTRLKLPCRHALPAAGPIPVQLLAVVGATGRSPRASVLPVGPCVQRLGLAADCVALARPAWLSGVGRRRGTL